MMFGSSTSPKTLNVVTFSTLYPNMVEPSHGIFVENRLRHLISTGRVDSRVVAPVPWFPFSHDRFGSYARKARVEPIEKRHGLTVWHPRYLVVPKVGMSFAPRSLFLATFRLFTSLEQQRSFDLIDAHYFYPDGVAAVMLGARLRKPVVITARGTDINLIPRYAVPRHMIRWAAARATGIVAVSAALKEALVDLGIPDDRIIVLRNGVDLTMFHPGPAKLPDPASRPGRHQLLSVGHLIERKSHDLIIGALPLLPGFTLLIVGTGPEKGRLEALTRQLGVSERVTFLGAVKPENMCKIYQTADALVLASSREGWPNVLLEAIACGTPVVASNIWGNPEIVTQPEAGVLMTERSPEGVAEAVKRLFASQPDRAATRRFAERFSWEETSTGQLELFTRVLGR
jgi:glycosyltransferase involved in cell wall biosynthesis